MAETEVVDVSNDSKKRLSDNIIRNGRTPKKPRSNAVSDTVELSGPNPDRARWYCHFPCTKVENKEKYIYYCYCGHPFTKTIFTFTIFSKTVIYSTNFNL